MSTVIVIYTGMVSHPRSAPTEGLTAQELRVVRGLSLIAGVVYLTWWFVVESVLPRAVNPLPSRLLVVGYFFALYALSLCSRVVCRQMTVLFGAGVWLLTGHYFWLLHQNHGDAAWSIGAYITIVAVSACLLSRRALLAYSIFVLVLSVGVACVDRVLLWSIFLPGMATMLLLANVSLRSRLLFEEERAARIHSQAARAAAEAGLALRDEFIAVAAHELRTPLTALQIGVQRLFRNPKLAELQGTESFTRAQESCQRQLTRLARLIDGLLDVKRIESREPQLLIEALDLAEVTRMVVESLAEQAAAAGSRIELRGDAVLPARWDRLRFEQVVINLVRNAISFGLGKPIGVEISAIDDRVRLAVIDQGIGIEPQDQERIFERFERAVSARHYGGLGLGLYLVRQIVQYHGGVVRVESAAGQGSTFVVEVPRECSGPTAAELG